MAKSLTKKQIEGLSHDVARSRRKMQPFRRFRTEALKIFSGCFYSDDGATKDVPINLIELFTMTYRALLAAGSAAVMITTKKASLKAEAYGLQEAVNNVAKDIRLNDTLKEFVTDAIFCMGILDVSHTKMTDVEIDGFYHDVGKPYAERISFDDFVWDMDAKRRDQIHFAGHDYEWRKDLLEDIPWVDRKALSELKPISYSPFDEMGDERAASISRGQEGDIETTGLYEKVRLRDMWLPMENKIYTFGSADGSIGSADGLGPKIGEREWYGPECGRYHYLGFTYIPDQLIPLPPVASWRSLADKVARAWRKMDSDHENEKTIGVATTNGQDDASRVVKANNGEVISVTDPNAVKELTFRGVKGSSFGYAVDLLGRASWQAGNIESLAGLSAQSETAKGEQLIGQAASARPRMMQKDTRECVASVFEAIAWYVSKDPVNAYEITKRLPGSKLEIETEFVPADMEGDHLDYCFGVQPYSMEERTPKSELETLMTLVERVLVPFQQQMAEAGMAVNIEGLIRQAAEYMGTPDLANLVIFSEMSRPQEGGPGLGEGAAAKPANTSRTYNRTSSGGAQGTPDQQLVSQLMTSGGGQE